jgi:hypothetical protein
MIILTFLIISLIIVFAVDTIQKRRQFLTEAKPSV